MIIRGRVLISRPGATSSTPTGHTQPRLSMRERIGPASTPPETVSHPAGELVESRSQWGLWDKRCPCNNISGLVPADDPCREPEVGAEEQVVAVVMARV